MHIAFLASQDCIHVCRWANSLIDRGYKITLFTQHRQKHELSDSVNIINLPFSKSLGYLLNIPFLKKKLKELNPDIVHAFYAFGYGFMARMSGFKPTVLSVMGSEVFQRMDQNRLFKAVILANINRATEVCSTSEVMAKKIESVAKNEVPITITPFGINTERFEPKSKIDKDREYDFVVGTVKWLKHYYGPDLLIQAFYLFQQEFPEKRFKLTIIGDGEEMKRTKELAKRLGVIGICEFTGNIPHKEIPEILNKMDVYVALSRRESFGVAVLEASACGIPVVVSDAGGLPEVVEDGKTGIVVPKEDVVVAAKALVKLYENRSYARELGVNGRNRVKQKYSWHQSLGIMEDVYKKVLANN